MAAVEAKSQELQGMSAVGADIESVKSQLEEHKVRQTLIHFFTFSFFQFCHFIQSLFFYLSTSFLILCLHSDFVQFCHFTMCLY